MYNDPTTALVKFVTTLTLYADAWVYAYNHVGLLVVLFFVACALITHKFVRAE